MNFFKQFWVQVVAWVMWLTSTVVLLINGITETQFNSVLLIVIGILGGISALIIAIKGLLQKKETAKK